MSLSNILGRMQAAMGSKRLRYVMHVMFAHAVQETFRSFMPAARTSSTVLEVEFHPDMSPRPGPLEQGALESPKKLEELDRQEEVRPCPLTPHTVPTICPAVAVVKL